MIEVENEIKKTEKRKKKENTENALFLFASKINNEFFLSSFFVYAKLLVYDYDTRTLVPFAKHDILH